MKTKEEIQRAHDLLLGILLDEIPLKLPKDMEKNVRSAAAVLCWVLDHKHNPTFQKNLECLEGLALNAGFILVNKSN